MSLLTNTMALEYQLGNACKPKQLNPSTYGQEAFFDPFMAGFVAAKSNLRVAVIGAPIQYSDPELSACLIGYHDFSKPKSTGKLEKEGTSLAIESSRRAVRLSQKREDQIQLLVANVVNPDGLASTYHLVKALHWAFDLNADVIYCHLQGDMNSFWLQSIKNKIEERNIIFVSPEQTSPVPVTLSQMKTKTIDPIESSFVQIGEMCEGPLVGP